jgi:hypothetical protein
MKASNRPHTMNRLALWPSHTSSVTRVRASSGTSRTTTTPLRVEAYCKAVYGQSVKLLPNHRPVGSELSTSSA